MIYTSGQLQRALQSQYREVQTRGFRQALASLRPADECLDEWPQPDFIPDAFALWLDELELHLFEIEITHPMPRDKLAQVGLFVDEMKGYGWAVYVHTVNRYGHLSTLDPFEMYMVAIRQAVEERCAQQT